jgi:RNA polymerase sigma-70 factor (ECF subfamily)
MTPGFQELGMAEDRRVAEAQDAHEDEEATVIAAQGRDPVALTLLYERYVRPVYRYLYSQIGDPADAEDLTSQTFLSALEALPRYRHRGRFAAWLFVIARRKALDYFRRNRPQVDLDTLPLRADGADPAGQVIQSQDWQGLSQRIAALSDEEQDLLRLRFVADLSFAEIGAILGKREQAAKKSLYRLLSRLQNQMENDHG